jgi:5'-methylthioadenosine phosphorylase
LDTARDIAFGVFGGSGFYSLLDDAEELAVDTPYGPPSARIRVGDLNGVRVAFMPRHGDVHTLPPHRVNYRANVWAMHKLGVTRIVGPSACGSLNSDIPPGTFVLCDQFVDRTNGREDTFYDGPQTTHVAGAHPYCPDLRRVLHEAARAEDIPVRETGTVVVIQGPRFSTRAESAWFSSFGDVVNMTQYPEAWLARELEICYANVSLVTDWDAGVGGVEPVTAEAAIRVFDENLGKLRALLLRAAPQIGPQPDDDICATALSSAVIH